MDAEDSFLRQHYEYYQAWHHWLEKAKKLKRASQILLDADLPELRLYDQAYKTALKEIGKEGKALVRHAHPDLLPAFSMFGSALESLFKAVMVNNDPGLVGADRLAQDLKSHDLVRLAKDAAVPLDDREGVLLAWLSEVVIWKARYSVPTNVKFGDMFFHRLDNISLADAEACMETLEGLFARTTDMLPAPPPRSTDGFDLLMVWKESGSEIEG
ncbi:hypothetical protein V1282_003564 [Nitrobacteraceae bacterium AZCC 2146]